MLLLRLAEIGSILLFAIFIVSQLIVPALRGVRMFPWFRRRQLEETLMDLREEGEQRKLKDEIDRMRAKFKPRDNPNGGTHA